MISSEAFDVVVTPVQRELADRGIETIRLELASAERTLPDVLPDAEIVYCPGAFPFGSRELDLAPRLRALVSIYTGTEGFDESAASARAVLVANGQVAENCVSMAEAAILLMLAAVYDLEGAQRAMAPSRGRRRRPATLLRGKAIGLIGYGQIGRAIAERLEHGWGVQFLIATPRPNPPFPRGAKIVPLDTLVEEADIICLVAPLKPDTVNLLSRERLARTKRGSVLVNISRGRLIDEEALFDLADGGHFSAIALDVFATEPLPPDSKLRSLPNAILTPHSLGHTRDSARALIKSGVENISAALAGTTPQYLRNPETLPQWLERWSRDAR